MKFGKAILGDNQFLGVNHANQAKASELFERFNDADKILEVIGFAYAAGVRDFMFTTHDRYELVFDEIRRSNLFPEMFYTPCLPYAHKYWNQLSDKGVLSLFASTIMQVNPMRVIPAGLAMLAGKTRGITQMLTEIEILMCKGLPLRGVFLQNLAFDFLMAMNLNKVIFNFADVVANKLGILPGFITMNHPKAVEVLCNEIGLQKPWLCANYNVAGFRMHPSQTICEASFASLRTNNIAMSVFASGRANPSESMKYVIDQMRIGGIDSILFGSSNSYNIQCNAQQILLG